MLILAKLPKQRGVAISVPAANGAPRMPVNNPISNLQAYQGMASRFGQAEGDFNVDATALNQP